jgi:hypothetical protein
MRASSRSPHRRAPVLALVASASAAAGWTLGNGEHGGRLRDRPVAPAIVAPSAEAGAAQQAVEGLASWTDGAGSGNPSCAGSGDDPPAADPEAIATVLAHGTEAERYDALVNALEAAVDLPPELLWQTYQHDAAERVRLLAFQTYADAKASEPAALREALQAGSVDASPDVRTEAEFRMAELDAYELASAYREAATAG